MILERKPWQLAFTTWIHHVNADPSLDADEYVTYDQNLDGTMDGTFVIPAAQFETHQLYTTGEFTD